MTFEPRDRVLAGRTAAGLLAVVGLVTGVFAIWDPAGDRGVEVVVLGISVLLLCLAVLALRSRGRARDIWWTLLPLLGIVLVTVEDLITADASASGQIFYCLPVIYAASQLRAVPAYVTTGLAVLASTAVAIRSLSVEGAVTSTAFMTTALVAVTVLLVRSGERQERLMAELRRMAAIDPLTGLVTRRVLDEAARSAMSGASRDGGTVLILIDVDHFKNINDGHGHLVGDDALKHVAAVLNSCSRPDDVVCRMGGDEVAVLLPGCSPEVGMQRAEQIVATLRRTPMPLPDGGSLTITASVGIAHVPTDGADLQTLYAAADTCLYNAKSRGRDRVGHWVSLPDPRV
ncbi:GGDEF domain-containing protein [Nakamurella silvestris]|nr:GGDEF domain-containing protein [Nakamurella silvestris]